jgi:S1-C subfamily serine protease
VATLQEISDELAAVVERVAQSVVRVDARRGRAGTGIVFSPDSVLTADHVVEDEENIEVNVNGTGHKASIAGRDPSTDIAVLKVEGLKAPVAARGNISDLRIGNLVLAIGRPGELHATLGVISSLSAGLRSWRGSELSNLIQTNAELLPGFSGGPLVDIEGRVVGVNSWHLGRGISRSIPIDTAARVAEKLKAHGRIRRAYLGVGAQPVPLSQPWRDRLQQESGLMVVTVEPDAAAGKAGLLQGDTIVAMDATPLRHLQSLYSALRGLEVGSEHTLKVIRAGESRDLKITLGERTN